MHGKVNSVTTVTCQPAGMSCTDCQSPTDYRAEARPLSRAKKRRRMSSRRMMSTVKAKSPARWQLCDAFSTVTMRKPTRMDIYRRTNHVARVSVLCSDVYQLAIQSQQ